MKKIALLSLLLFFSIFILRSFIFGPNTKLTDGEFNSQKFESISQSKKVEGQISLQDKPSKKPLPPSHSKLKKRKKPNSLHQYKNEDNNKEIDPLHSAQTDQSGKIFPRSVKVDDEYIVAYGDLIIGSADDLSDYQSGEKHLDIPPPVLWPKGDIPYELDSSLDDPIQKELIKRAVEHLNTVSGINFHPRKNSEESYVLFKRGDQHCYANVGFRVGVSYVSLSPGCGEKEIYHELFHVLGFFHEQNRPDRDDHIEVLWENIDEENWTQFERFSVESYPEALQDLNNLPFEFESIMLYDSYSFSNSSDYSMVKIDGTSFSHQLIRPSYTDLELLKLLYP